MRISPGPFSVSEVEPELRKVFAVTPARVSVRVAAIVSVLLAVSRRPFGMV